MPDRIHVEPTQENRHAFAAWAVAQDPKVRTASATSFAVPHHLFTEVPERLLIGSLVDGRRYVSPEDTPESGGSEAAAPVTGDLTGVATAEGFQEAVAGEPLPPLPDEAYPADAEPLPEPELDPGPQPEPELDPGPQPEPEQDADPDAGRCQDCGRVFRSQRGLATHRRQVHQKE
ncbi:hypothetical protein [Streptomyces sp. AJS327]|uniref:hypothetical protein n=1 Tax=Streptomyces sp. AJS327 TaxID=2545265 RepID=UPI0015DD7032|nr:hypothetical protein [Streptomyces sp. AJS327]